MYYCVIHSYQTGLSGDGKSDLNFYSQQASISNKSFWEKNLSIIYLETQAT